MLTALRAKFMGVKIIHDVVPTAPPSVSKNLFSYEESADRGWRQWVEGSPSSPGKPWIPSQYHREAVGKASDSGTRRWRQEDQQCKVILGYIRRFRPAWAT